MALRNSVNKFAFCLFPNIYGVSFTYCKKMPRRSASSSSKNYSPYSRSQSRTPNGYIIFCKFYKETLGREYPNLSPQKRMAKTGEMWNSLPNDLKNSFITFANHDRILKSQSKLDCQCLSQGNIKTTD